jgi:hypothetical protein
MGCRFASSKRVFLQDIARAMGLEAQQNKPELIAAVSTAGHGGSSVWGENQPLLPKLPLVYTLLTPPPTHKPFLHFSDETVSKEHLSYLTRASLKAQCYENGLSKSGPKSELVARLSKRVKYLSLVKLELQDILRYMGLPSSGNKDELVKRIFETPATEEVKAAARHFAEREKFLETASEKTTGLASMSKKQYRNFMADKGLPLEDDQVVCHIIAEKNGGADHFLNYHPFCGKMNSYTLHRHDYFFASVLGHNRTKRAVDISRKLGNKKGVKYAGPSAAVLFSKKRPRLFPR